MLAVTQFLAAASPIVSSRVFWERSDLGTCQATNISSAAARKQVYIYIRRYGMPFLL